MRHRDGHGEEFGAVFDESRLSCVMLVDPCALCEVVCLL